MPGHLIQRARLFSGHRSRQRGMASIIVVVLLIAGVIYVLGQTLGIVGSRSADTAGQLDSTAALALAESGLQRAQAVVVKAAGSGLMTSDDCTGVATGSPFSLGRGSFSYGTPVSDPATCNSGTGTTCSGCSVPVTGTVGSASRSLNLNFNMTQSYGVAGNGQTVTMVLKNIHTVPAVALFHMGWKRQDAGGNANATICGICGMAWNVESGSGNPSVGGMGVTVDIAALVLSQVVTQNISQSRDYVEVGALFPSTNSSLPTVVGGAAYWNDDNGGGNGSRTVNNSNATPSAGQVNSGAVAAVSGTCSAPPTTYGSGSTQSCNSWCYGGDTLVFGVAARSGTAANEVTGVSFNTSGTPAQNVALTRIVHYPNTDGSTTNASGTLYSEIWYAYNADYMSSATGGGATSYTSSVKATAGATITLSANMSNGDTAMPVASLADANSQICVGDKLDVGLASKLTGSEVTATPGGTCSSLPGNYTIDPGATGNVNKNSDFPKASSTVLLVQGTTGSNFTPGATNTAGVTIASGPSGGAYTLSAAAYLPTTSYVTQGAASATTIRVPSGTALPSVGTRVAVHTTGGAGALAAGTLVASVGANAFTVDTAATTSLAGSTVCGGTCAFFNTPSSTSSVTEFVVTRSGGTTQWGGGFVCLKGVDGSLIAPVTSTTASPGTWQEVVQ